MTRLNIDILGISALKWTGMGEFNSDDHQVYYCGQESLRRNGAAFIVNKRVGKAVLGYNLQNDRMISVRIQGKPFNTTIVQVYAPTTGAEEAEVDRFCEGLQHLLELTPKNDVLIIMGDWNAKVGKELYKKELNIPDNHDGVVIDLKPDILECEVKWALGSLSNIKASGGDSILAELFKILKDDAVKVLHSICQQIWKTQQWPQDWKREFQKNIYFCFIDYAKVFVCVDHNKLWQVLKDMGVPDHLICLLRNLYVGQEATVRNGHGTDWFKIEKGVRQGCILLPCLFNLYAEHIMRKAGLDESPVGIKIAGRNINNLTYADDTTRMAESEEELKSLLMWVKEKSAKVGLKLNIKKTKIMASGPLTSWQIDGEEMEVVTDFIFLGSKITADGDCSQEIKRCLLLGRKAMANLDSILKSRDITLPTKVRIVKAMVFPVATLQHSCLRKENNKEKLLQTSPELE
ncbi:Craniofacial development protein 2 [Varanus komodoensis]|nr:Craniofacial development protein 2 [Varanus komodoensis]